MFRCRRELSAVLIVGLGAMTSGCLVPSYIPWTKPGVTDRQKEADYSACQSEVREETQRSYAINTDITAVHKQDWQNAGIYKDQVMGLTAGDAELSQRLFASCMAGHGYKSEG